MTHLWPWMVVAGAVGLALLAWAVLTPAEAVIASGVVSAGAVEAIRRSEVAATTYRVRREGREGRDDDDRADSVRGRWSR